MKERPILFSAAMVRAILDGRKTQTRRIAKISDPIEHAAINCQVVNFRKKTYWFNCQKSHPDHIANACPHGIFGDRLWVRESWSTHACLDNKKPSELINVNSYHYWADGEINTGKKRPSIHMPRWASRIDLEITGIRVERLQDISEDDAKAEGAQRFDNIPIGTPRPYRNEPDRWSMENPLNTDYCLSTPRYAFANIFEKINGQGSWDKNPWVWVIEFKQITK